jgi:hypothetical protein
VGTLRSVAAAAMPVVWPVVDEHTAAHQRIQQFLARALRIIGVPQRTAGVDQRELDGRSL